MYNSILDLVVIAQDDNLRDDKFIDLEKNGFSKTLSITNARGDGRQCEVFAPARHNRITGADVFLNLHTII